MEKIKIINGHFYEKQKVTLLMPDGKIITRRVYFDTEAKDLSITYKCRRYFYLSDVD